MGNRYSRRKTVLLSMVFIALLFLMFLVTDRKTYASVEVFSDYSIVRPGKTTGFWVEGNSEELESVTITSSNKKVAKITEGIDEGINGLFQVKGIRKGIATIYVKHISETGQKVTDAKIIVQVGNYKCYRSPLNNPTIRSVKIKNKKVIFKGSATLETAKGERQLKSKTRRISLAKKAYVGSVESDIHAVLYRKLSRAEKQKWAKGKNCSQTGTLIYVIGGKVVAILTGMA